MAAASQSCNSNVFLSFRGEDTRKTFVDYLYSTLVGRMISTYKDDITLPRGESIRPSLFKAIEGSRIAVIIFSEKYADSSWCLEELEHIIKCMDERKLIVMPIFYCVDPSEVRKQKGKFGEAFARHEKENINKVESWRKALVRASEIAGWEPKNIANGHEMEAIKEIVDIISKNLLSFPPDIDYIDEDLVGMSVRMQELEAQLQIGSGGVHMIGIWGIGGSGKTTLASSLCMKISHQFQGYCIIDNIREDSIKDGLKKLQEKIISRLFEIKIELQSIQQGKKIIKDRLNQMNVLIILDDVDHNDQLDALAGSRSWFGSGSRIIITTRNEQLLKSHKVDRVCPVTLLSPEEAIQLFNKRAYSTENPVEDYETLSSSVVSYAAGLPLALKVLGSFLCGKGKDDWKCTLERLKDNPEMEIVEKLKISYDGLKPFEKELFLDIACFFRWESTHEAIEIFEACGYYPVEGIRTLMQKSLITIVDDKFDMHDLIQEMGHYIVKGGDPNNPEKHSRVWENKSFEYLAEATMENGTIEALYTDVGVDASGFYKMISNMKKLRWLIVRKLYGSHAQVPNFLSNELRYIYWEDYPRCPIPDTSHLMKLVVLRLSSSLQEELWRGTKRLPHLKVLELEGMKNLVYTPDFNGLPSLQKLKILNCQKITELDASLGYHTSVENISLSYCGNLRVFPKINRMGKLKSLNIDNCHRLLEFPEINSNMKSLVTLSLRDMGIDALLSSIGERCANLKSLHFFSCYYSTITEVNFDRLKHLDDFRSMNLRYKKKPDHQLSIWLRPLLPQLTTSLQKLVLNDCYWQDGEMPSDIGQLTNLVELNLRYNKFTRIEFSLSQLTKLKLLDLSYCKQLVELPELPSRLDVLRADECHKLTAIGDSHKSCKSLCQVSLIRGSIINDGSRLLESLLQRNASKNKNMILRLEGFYIAKEFILFKGNRCRLKLPENWCNDFSGFLMCAVVSYDNDLMSISMKHVMSNSESEDDVGWEVSGNDKKTTVWYVSFASLRHTKWWNSIYKAVSISFQFRLYRDNLICSGSGVRMVPRQGRSGLTEASRTQEESKFSGYTPKVRIFEDSQYALEFSSEKHFL